MPSPVSTKVLAIVGLGGLVAVAVIHVLLGGSYVPVKGTNTPSFCGDSATVSRDLPELADAALHDVDRSHDSQVVRGTGIHNSIRQLLSAADLGDWEEARAYSIEIRGTLDRSGNDTSILLQSLDNELAVEGVSRVSRSRRVGYLVHSLPLQDVVALFRNILSEWQLPLSGVFHDSWNQVNHLKLEVKACEAVFDERHRGLLSAIGFSLLQDCIYAAADAAHARAAAILTLALDAPNQYLADPSLSFIIREFSFHRLEVTPQRYGTLLGHLRAFHENERFSQRLRVQIGILFNDELSSSDDLLRALGNITDTSEAVGLISSYLNAVPQLEGGVGELFRILLQRLKPGDAHRALATAFGSVSWLKSRAGLNTMCAAIASADLNDHPDSLFLKTASLRSACIPFRLNSGTASFESLLFPPDTMDATQLLRGWIMQVPAHTSDYDYAKRSLAIGNLGYVILDSCIDLTTQLLLLRELVARAVQVDPVAQRIILARLCQVSVDALLAQMPDVLTTWSDLFTAPYSRHAAQKKEVHQRYESFAIFESSEYILALCGYPRLDSIVVQTLLERYADAMSLQPGSPYSNATIKDCRAKLESQFLSLHRAGYFN